MFNRPEFQVGVQVFNIWLASVVFGFYDLFCKVKPNWTAAAPKAENVVNFATISNKPSRTHAHM